MMKLQTTHASLYLFDLIKLLPPVARALQRGHHKVLLELGLEVVQAQLSDAHALALNAQLVRGRVQLRRWQVVAHVEQLVGGEQAGRQKLLGSLYRGDACAVGSARSGECGLLSTASISNGQHGSAHISSVPLQLWHRGMDTKPAKFMYAAPLSALDCLCMNSVTQIGSAWPRLR